MTPRHCSILLQLLFGVICSCYAVEYGWLPRQEFVFSVEGQSLAGLPQLTQQFAGFQYRGQLRVQSHGPRILLLKLSNMSFTKIHEELRDGWWAGAGARLKNKTIVMPTPTSTIVVKLTKTSSPELIMKSGLDDWQINFIKGLVRNIVTFMGNPSESTANSNQRYTTPKDVYTVIEDSVVGRCETLYEVTKIPSALSPVESSLCGDKQHWEVTKTRNYSNCEVVSEDHSHLPMGDCPPASDHCGNFWTRASLTQMIGCGEKNNFVLLRSISSSIMVSELHLQNKSQANINSNLNITLLSAHQLSDTFNTPSNKQTVKSLLYSYSTSIKESGNVSEEETTDNPPKGHSYSQTNPASNKKGMDRNKQHSKPRFTRSSQRQLNYQDESEHEHGSDDSIPNTQSNEGSANDSNTIYDTSDGSTPQISEGSFEDQPSDEMQLEDQLEISGKEARITPPYQPFSMFSLAHRTSYSLSCLNPKLRQLVGDIASDLEEINILPEKNTMDKLNIAVDICRSLPLDMLKEVSEEVFEVLSQDTNSVKENQRRVFRDVVMMCGTHPALQLIKGWVERRQVVGEEAAEVIAAIPSNIISPTKYMIQDFFELVKQVDAKKEPELRSAGVLALSNLVRYACVNPGARQRYYSSIVKPVCDQSLAGHVTEWISQRVYSETDVDLRNVYIHALGNIGSADTVSRLSDIALQTKYSIHHRTSAVYAMRYQALKRGSGVSSVLLSLYNNYALPISSRLAAVTLLVYSNPGPAVWQRLAISTWYEPSPAVQQFVSSTLRTMAETRDSHYSHVVKAAKLVLPLSKPARLDTHQPYNLLVSWLSSDLENIILEQITWMQLPDYTSLYYRHSSRMSGFSRTNLEATLESSNPDDLWSALSDLMMLSYDESPGQGHGSRRNVDNTFAKIRKHLGVQTRNMPQLQADLYIKINNMLEFVQLLDHDKLKHWQRDLRKFLSDIREEGKSLSYQKAYLNSFHISSTTEMGFPIEFSVRTPSIIQAKLQLNLTDSDLTAGISFMYSSQLVSSVNVMSPWDNTAHTAAAYATNFIQLPYLRIAAKLDKPNEALKVKTYFIDQHRLLYVSMQPFTSQRKLKIHHPALLSPDTRKIKLKETVQMPIHYSWMSHYLNSVYTSEENSDFNPMNFIHQARGVLGFPLLLPNMEARSFEVVMNPLHPVTMSFSLNFGSKSSNMLELYSPKNTILGQIYDAWSDSVRTHREPKPSDQQETDFSMDNIDQTIATIAGNDTTAPEKFKRKDNEMADQNKNNTEHKEMKKITPDEIKLIHSSEPTNRGIKLYTKTFESATGEFNASSVDPFENQINGSNHYYLIDTVLGKINSGRAVVVSLDLSSSHQEQPVQVSAYGTYAEANSRTVSRYGFFLKKDDTEVKVTAVQEHPDDIVTDLKRLLKEDVHHKIYTDFVYKHHGQTANVFFQAKMGVAESTAAQLLSSPQLESCSQSIINGKCQHLQLQARELGSWNFAVFYNDEARYIENLARMYMITARMTLPETIARPGEVNSNSMFLRMETRRHSELVEVYAAIPGKTLEVHNIPFSIMASPYPTILEWATQSSLAKDYCGISTDLVRTFDGAEFKNTFKKQMYLIAQDCSGKYNVLVIAKPSQNNSLSFDVYIDDQFVVSLEQGPKILVNRNLQPLDTTTTLLQLIGYNGHTVAHAVYSPDNSIQLLLPNHALQLVYTGQALIIRAEARLRGRLCGLCGSYSGSGLEAFLTPQGKPASSTGNFISSYQMNDNEF